MEMLTEGSNIHIAGETPAQLATRRDLQMPISRSPDIVRKGCVCPLGLAHFAHLIWPTLKLLININKDEL